MNKFGGRGYDHIEDETRIQVQRRTDFMADSNSGGSNAAVVAIFVIFVLIVIAAIFMFGGQFFGGSSGGTKKVDVNVHAPAVPSKSP